MITQLCAEHDDESLVIAEGLSKKEAAGMVRDMEAHISDWAEEHVDELSVAEKIETGIWPEGYDAVFVDGRGRRTTLED